MATIYFSVYRNRYVVEANVAKNEIKDKLKSLNVTFNRLLVASGIAFFYWQI